MAAAADATPELRASDAGVLLPVRVTPRGRRSAITGVRNGRLLLTVTAAPVDNAANEAVIETVAAALGLSKSRVTLVRGHKAREKILLIGRCTVAELSSQLARIFAE